MELTGSGTEAPRPLRILIVCDWFMKLVVDGQAHALRELGHEVALLCRRHAFEFAGAWSEREQIMAGLREIGVTIFELPGRRFGPETFLPTIRLWRKVRDWEPDVVSAHENYDPRLWLASRPTPAVYTVHDPEPHPGAAAPHLGEKLAAALWSSSARRLVVHGPQLALDLPEHLARRSISVVPHGIRVAKEPLAVPGQAKILLFGRLEPYKGVSVLVRAMQEVWDRRPDVELVVAGRGPAARDIPMDARIALREGYIPEAELPRLLREASVVVLPYTQASQSGVGLLSIAHGIPTVVTRVGALPELAPDARYVAEPRDPAALAHRLLHALDASEAERTRILEFARHNFDWNRVAKAYSSVYQEVARPAHD